MLGAALWGGPYILWLLPSAWLLLMVTKICCRIAVWSLFCQKNVYTKIGANDYFYEINHIFVALM